MRLVRKCPFGAARCKEPRTPGLFYHPLPTQYRATLCVLSEEKSHVALECLFLSISLSFLSSPLKFLPPPGLQEPESRTDWTQAPTCTSYVTLDTLQTLHFFICQVGKSKD